MNSKKNLFYMYIQDGSKYSGLTLRIYRKFNSDQKVSYKHETKNIYRNIYRKIIFTNIYKIIYI